MPTIKNNYLLQKRNVLNEIRSNNMTLQELRFFSIYLSKINKDKPDSTRVVRFPLDDFRAILELGRMDIKYVKSITNSLLGKIVNVPDEYGGYTGFQLFKKCRVSVNENGEWYVEIDAHDDALPLMFEFKNKYFSYQLWNALRLKSSNQLRMYEVLKQYEKIGHRVLLLEDLRELLGIKQNEYPRYDNFKTRVLDSCQEALKIYTDIVFFYEPTGKRGRGGKINALKFTIFRNENYQDKLSLDEFINQQKIVEGISVNESGPSGNGGENYFTQEVYPFLAESCENEFNVAEMQVLYNMALKIIPARAGQNIRIELYDYLKRKYDELKWQATRRPIKSRFGYLKKLIDVDLKNED